MIVYAFIVTFILNVECLAYQKFAHRLLGASRSRALGICSGKKGIYDAFSVIESIRHHWNASISAVIVHCDELGEEHLPEANLRNASLFNVCDDSEVLITKYKHSKSSLNSRLRSWWCKAAALISLPFDEVMVVDVDVIWFNNPELLFDAAGYIETGTLFFRDRVAKDNRLMQSKIENLIIREAPELNITSEEVARYKQMNHYHHTASSTYNSTLSEHGISFFFNSILNRNAPSLSNHQDSSVILVNRSKHPILLEVLSKLFIDFNIGWGDKELYWVSAIISNEPFAFEPFLIGSYGDCGYMLHYDPRQANEEDKSKIRPFFMNAEWLINKISSVGHDLEYMMSTPQLVTKDMTLHDIGSAHGCTFRFYGWVEVPFDCNQKVLRALWNKMSRRIKHYYSEESDADLISHYEKQCIPVFVSAIAQVSVMVNKIIENGKCGEFGCSIVPIPFNQTKPQVLCIPVTFDFHPPKFNYTLEKLNYLGDNCSTIITPILGEYLVADRRTELLRNATSNIISKVI